LRQKQWFAAKMASNPRSLELVTSYCDALFTLGEFKELLKVSSAALDKVARAPKEIPPYDDLDKWLGWTYNLKSIALSGHGREKEGTQILADWRTDPRNTQSKVSQAINLGALQNYAGKPEEALQALEGIDWVKGLSAYGRLQFQEVRLDAYLQLGRQDEADTVLAWFHEHQLESPATAQLAFLKAGDLDAAAAVLVARLENSDTRAEALASMQEFKSVKHGHVRRSEYQQRVKAYYGKLYSRADVLAAIAKYGRIESFPVYNTGR
jgi:hypothetical protein